MLRTLSICVGLSLLATCATVETEGELGETEQYLVRSNKVALNKVALNKVALNKVALNLVGVNKVALNKVALNKVALNQASLELAVPSHSLARVEITWDGSEYDVRVTRRAQDGTTLADTNDEGTSFRDVSAPDLVNIFEKSARCLNPEGVSTEIVVDGIVENIDATGMFQLASRGLTHRQYIEAYMACMAVWANDQPLLINATAELPATQDVRSTAGERVMFNIPAESVAYTLTLGATINDGGTVYVEIDGRWLWNLSRHQAWSATFERLRGWMSVLGTYDRTPNRACLAAAIAHEPMPAVCGGTASEYWPGPLTPNLLVPTNENTAPWCGGRLGVLIDYTKGTGCNSPRGPVSSVFYADLSAPFEDYLWGLIIAEMSGLVPGGGKGSGSGSGSGKGDGS